MFTPSRQRIYADCGKLSTLETNHATNTLTLPPLQNSTQVHPIFPVPIRLARIRIYSAQPEILIINVKLFAINVSLFCESLCVFASSDRPNCYFSFLRSRGTFSLPQPLLSRHFHSLFCNGEEEGKWERDLRSFVLISDDDQDDGGAAERVGGMNYLGNL